MDARVDQSARKALCILPRVARHIILRSESRVQNHVFVRTTTLVRKSSVVRNREKVRNHMQNVNKMNERQKPSKSLNE